MIVIHLQYRKDQLNVVSSVSLTASLAIQQVNYMTSLKKKDFVFREVTAIEIVFALLI